MKKYLSLSLAAFLGLSIVGCAPEATEPAPVDNVSDVDPADHEMPGAAHSPEGGSTEGGEAAPAEGGEAAPAEGGEAAPAEGGEAAPAAE